MKKPIAIALVAFSTICLAGKIEIPGGKKVTKDGVLSISADWVKDKGDKFDIALNLKSESKESLLILVDDLHCKRGAQDGTVSFTHGSDKAIELTPAQLKRVTMVCDVRESTKGHFYFTVGRVFTNPTGDGKTRGKILATNIEWTLSQWDAQ